MTIFVNGQQVGASGGGGASTSTIDLSSEAQSTVSTADVVIGGRYFDPASWEISGRTTTLTLEAIGQVVSGVTGTLTLHNATDASTAATLTWTETVATRKTAAVTLPASAKIYELRIKKSGGGASDYALVYGVNLLVSWS